MSFDRDGLCPKCGESTTAGESCCGAGAIVDGGVVSDEDVWEVEDRPDDADMGCGCEMDGERAVICAYHQYKYLNGKAESK